MTYAGRSGLRRSSCLHHAEVKALSFRLLLVHAGPGDLRDRPHREGLDGLVLTLFSVYHTCMYKNTACMYTYHISTYYSIYTISYMYISYSIYQYSIYRVYIYTVLQGILAAPKHLPHGPHRLRLPDGRQVTTCDIAHGIDLAHAGVLVLVHLDHLPATCFSGNIHTHIYAIVIYSHLVTYSHTVYTQI